MKKLHKDHIAGFLFSLGNLLLFLGHYALSFLSSKYYSLLLYNLYRFSTILYPLLTICLYFLLRRKRTCQFTLCVALMNLAALVPTGFVLFITVHWLSLLFSALLPFVFAGYLPVAIDLLICFLSKRRAAKHRSEAHQLEAHSTPVTEPSTEETVFEGTQNPILHGIIYSAAYMLLNWFIFICIAATPFLDSDFSFIFFAFAWFASVPFYFILKQERSIAYFVSAVISLIAMSVVSFFVISILFDTRLLPCINEFLGGIIYFFPLIGLPIYGFIPIVIDGIIYIGKAIYRAMAVRESRR